MKKIIFTRNEDGVVTNIVTTAIDVPNGMLVDNAYIIAGLQDYQIFRDVETPNEIEVMKYRYGQPEGFTLNPNYVEPPEPIEERVARLEKAISDMILVKGGTL